MRRDLGGICNVLYVRVELGDTGSGGLVVGHRLDHSLRVVDGEPPQAAASHELARRAPEPFAPRLNSVPTGGMRNPTHAPAATAPAYVNEQELTRLTTLSRTTLQTLRSKGGGPPFAKLGRRIVYRLADVERWIEGRTR